MTNNFFISCILSDKFTGYSNLANNQFMPGLLEVIRLSAAAIHDGIVRSC